MDRCIRYTDTNLIWTERLGWAVFDAKHLRRLAEFVVNDSSHPKLQRPSAERQISPRRLEKAIKYVGIATDKRARVVTGLYTSSLPTPSISLLPQFRTKAMAMSLHFPHSCVQVLVRKNGKERTEDFVHHDRIIPSHWIENSGVNVSCFRVGFSADDHLRGINQRSEPFHRFCITRFPRRRWPSACVTATVAGRSRGAPSRR
jgi:hypothetical protein